MGTIIGTCGHEIKRVGYDVHQRIREYGARATVVSHVCPRCVGWYRRGRAVKITRVDAGKYKSFEKTARQTFKNVPAYGMAE